MKIDITTKQKISKYSGLTKLRREEAENKDEKVNREEILLAGSDNRKEGIKEVGRQVKVEQTDKKKTAEDILNRLDLKKKFVASYKRNLAEGLATLLGQLDWIKGWTADVLATDGRPITIKGKPFATKEGILLVVCTPDGRVFHQGMLSSGEPALDYSGIYTMAIQVENQMDSERGLLLDNNGDNSAIIGNDGQFIKRSGVPKGSN